MTLAELRAQCAVDPETQCWAWPGPTYENGNPQVLVDGVGRGARRRAVELDRGSPLGTDRCRLDCSAGRRNCINPAHAVVWKRKGLRSPPPATLAELRALCDVDAETDCWGWPRLWRRSEGHVIPVVGKNRSARRWAVELHLGAPLDGDRCRPYCSEGRDDCVNPEHAVVFAPPWVRRRRRRAT